MNTYDEIIGMITKVVLDVVRYNVPRLGIVSKIIDDLEKARILVLIPSLGWDTDEKGAWCWIVEKNGLSTPKVGDYVIIQFLDGDRDIPLYVGKATQMRDMLPDSYVDENTQILFENRAHDFSVRYEETNELLNIGEADESYVKGDTAKTELQKNVDALTQLQADFTAWTPVPNDGGAALKAILTGGFLTKAIASLANILSERIKGE